MDVRDDTTAGDRRLDEGVELLVAADGELEVARRDALDLEVLGGVARELEDLGGEVLCFLFWKRRKGREGRVRGRGQGFLKKKMKKKARSARRPPTVLLWRFSLFAVLSFRSQPNAISASSTSRAEAPSSKDRGKRSPLSLFESWTWKRKIGGERIQQQGEDEEKKAPPR